jgi:hypothetical protein
MSLSDKSYINNYSGIPDIEVESLLVREQLLSEHKADKPTVSNFFKPWEQDQSYTRINVTGNDSELKIVIVNQHSGGQSLGVYRASHGSSGWSITQVSISHRVY